MHVVLIPRDSRHIDAQRGADDGRQYTVINEVVVVRCRQRSHPACSIDIDALGDDEPIERTCSKEDAGTIVRGSFHGILQRIGAIEYLDVVAVLQDGTGPFGYLRFAYDSSKQHS